MVTGARQSGRNDEHLIMFTHALGKLPDELYRQWKTSSRYFTPNRELYNIYIGGVQEGEKPLLLPIYHSMEEMFDKEAPEMSEDEASQVKALVRRVLQYDPEKRPSAAELLDDPWFKEFDCSSPE